ncbi:hypothetical protein C4E24_06080 [ANME-1 cluster archaeon AG-394-G21]|nr:hypothetical protein [ANME-1 cluster archaeon AG-394-G21]
MEDANVVLILKEIGVIKKEIAYIKEHMIDMDRILTDEEIIILKEAEKEFVEGKTIKLEDIERNSE